jgi:alpha-L-rhamnosidase
MTRATYALTFLLLISGVATSKNKIAINATFCENKTEAIGINTEGFCFGWNMVSPERNVNQTAYHVLLVEDQRNFKKEKSVIWNSGKVASSKSIWIDYTGPKLLPGTTYFWKVKVWDNKGNESEWSQPARITTGLFSEKDWSGAKWIALDELDPAKRLVPGIHVPMLNKEWKNKKSGEHKLPVFRKEFSVKKKLKEALVFVTGLGQYELRLNGEKVGNHFLAPGWTDYDDSNLYNIYDVTHQVSKGKNAFGMLLGNGFYSVPNNRFRWVNPIYGNPKMILKLLLNYEDGTSETVVSDQSWKVTESPVTYSNLYSGETYNANLEPEGWDRPEFDDSAWKQSLVVSAPNNKLVTEMDYPLAVCETIAVKTIRLVSSVKNSYLYDFGQNASGIVELEVQGKKGDTVKIYPAELIKETLEAEQKATGSPYYYAYILKGNGVEKWAPRFTYYGFRYAQVIGAIPDTSKVNSGLPRIKSLKFLHTRNSSPETGTFANSFDLFNRVDQLIKWAIKSNFQSVMTDCPHREKLGWLEQTFLMGGAIHYNFDIYHSFNKLVDDMIEAQISGGMVPAIVPEYCVMPGEFRDSPEWGSASIIIPWMIYKYYGDIRPMEKAWPMMVGYMEHMKSKSNNYILSHGLGDWYDLGTKDPGFVQLTPVAATATAIYYFDARLMGQMASLIGKANEAKSYSVWAEEIRTAYNQKFLNPETNIYSTGSQTAIAMPLVLGLVPENLKDKVFQTLIESINKSDKALTAGDVGFHYLVKALQEGGAGDLLFEMNARDDVPGYGYQLKKGATALTESWPALDRVSNNHLMLGHLMEWFYGGLGGIDQTRESTAYKEVLIAPQMVNGVDSVSVNFKTPYGTVVSKWTKTAAGTLVEVEVPVNAKAIVLIPFKEGTKILENNIPVANSKNVKIVSQTPDKTILSVGSGKYRFDF